MAAGTELRSASVGVGGVKRKLAVVFGDKLARAGNDVADGKIGERAVAGVENIKGLSAIGNGYYARSR